MTEVRSCRLEVAHISTIGHQLCLTSLIAKASRVHAIARVVLLHTQASVAISLLVMMVLQVDSIGRLIRGLLARLWLVLIFGLEVLDVGLRVAERIIAAHALKA